MFLYDGKTSDEVREIVSANGHGRSVNSVDWFDDVSFASGSNDLTVKLWTVANEQDGLLKTLRVDMNPVNEVDEMQVGVQVVENDVFSLSLFGALNVWKDAREMAD